MKSTMQLSVAQFSRVMKHRNTVRITWLSLMLTALVAAGLIVGLRGGHAQSSGGQKSNPDYSKVDDFTNGATHLLRNDDLVMRFNYQAGGNGEARNVVFSAGTTNSNLAVRDFNQVIIPNGTAGCSNPKGCYLDTHAFAGSKLVTGRFFNTDKDVTVHYPVLFQLSTGSTPYLVVTGGAATTDSPPAVGLTFVAAQSFESVLNGSATFLTGVGDFNGDGFDDLVLGNSDASFETSLILRIATAANVDNPGLGFTFSTPVAFKINAGMRELAVGDFDGDRLPDIATLGADPGANLQLYTFDVDPSTLNISNGGSVQLFKLANTAVTTTLTMTVGRFTAARNQQIAVGFQIASGQDFAVQIVDFDPGSLQPKLMTTSQVAEGHPQPVLKLKAARIDWSSAYDQIVLMVGNNPGGTALKLLTVDPGNLRVTISVDYNFDGSAPNLVGFFGRDIAIGNFDRMEPSASDPTQMERNPDLQIAVIGMVVTPVIPVAVLGSAAIFEVSEATLTTPPAITKKSQTVFGPSYFGRNTLVEMSITAGDLQGRSFRLGAVSKITVDRVQPSVVLAMPPMHADYVSPKLGQAPTVLNLSVAPDGFKSEYEQTTSTEASTTQTDTISSSFAGEESLSNSFTWGTFNPSGELENGVKFDTTFTAKQDIKNSTDTINGAFNNSEFEMSQETGLSDVVWFKDTSYYLYVYPVIGRKICPADKADSNGNCADSEKVPLQIMFSAPKETTVQRLASDTLEWYQPPWEFGNLFSYPAGLAQLKQYLPDIQLLTADTTVFATDDAAATLRTTWANGRTTGQDIEHEELFTEDFDLSIEGKVGDTELGFGFKNSTGLNLNFGGSDGTKSLNVSDTKMSSARGLTITKQATLADPFSYKYFFSPYIFGKIQPVGYTDMINSTADLLAFGALRSAFTVNPLANGAGAFWSQSDYRQFPDVAVNHPSRWSYAAQGKPSNGVIPANCIGIDNFSMNCITPTEREPDNPWRDPFHDMRGFFINNALNPPPTTLNPFVPGNGGAQLETATAGDQLTLSTRVYNYSFKAMPAGTKVKVRFYGMLLDDQNLPINEDGGSFLIGEDALAPIAPFNNGPSAPLNWVLATTTFDTTGRENQALAFWVVVWMDDGNGNLVKELTGHGLTGIPTSSATPTFTGSSTDPNAITPLEEMVDNPLKVSPDDPAQVSFSNNIGFYRAVFHILPKTTATATGAMATRAAASVKVEKVEVSGTWLKPGRAVEASVTLRNSAQELYGVMVYFYDGDPTAGGKLVDVERVSRLRAGAQQKVSINFRPQLCGAHQLFVRVAPGKEHAVSGQAAQAVQVECPTPVCVSQVCMKSAQYYSLNLNRLPHGLVTIIGGGLNHQVSTGDTTRLRLLLQGGVARQLQLNRQFVATQLSLLAQVGGAQTALQSNLLCYQLNFQPVQLSNGVTLSPSMTLGELFAQVRQAGQSGDAIDQRLLTNLLQLLNGDDPQGRCRQ